jgi:hypothetical protein
MLLSSLAAWERRARAFECARVMGVVGDTGEEEGEEEEVVGGGSWISITLSITLKALAVALKYTAVG